MLAIKNNLMAANAARNLGVSYDNLALSIERLASGLRINSAKDDAAGLAVRELIRADVAALQQGSRNALDAVSMVQAAEGGVSMIDALLIRMRELAEQAATGTYSDVQVQIMQEEADELVDEVDRIANNTDFNSINLLTAADPLDPDDPTEYEITLGGGLVAGQTITIEREDLTADGLGILGAKEAASANRSVAVETANYVTGDLAGDAIKFSFGVVADDITITVGAASLTLAEVVAAVNVVSRGIDGSWDGASAAYNSDTGQYSLKLTNRVSGDVAFTVTNTGATAWAVGVGGGAIATADFIPLDGSDALTLGTQAAIDAIEGAIADKDSFRAYLGYMMNRLDSAAGVIDVQAENLMVAESRVSDVDVATEMAAFTRNQVLAQAGISMLAQANAMPQMALQLLRGG